MSERTRNVVATGVIAASLVFVTAVLLAEAPPMERRVESLAETLACPVCNGESIADSPSQLARDLYDLIEQQVASGMSDEEVRAFFVETYGPQSLLDPPTNSRTVWLWVLPALALLSGVILVVARKRSMPAGGEVTEADRARIASAIEARRSDS